MSDIGSPGGAVHDFPDRDLVDLAYVCALDAMAASEQYETMTRVDSSSRITRRMFTETSNDIRETMAFASHATRTPAPVELRSRILDALDSTSQEWSTAGSVTSLAGRRGRRTRWRAVTAVAAAAAVIAVGGIAVGTNLPTDSSTEQVQADGTRTATVAGGGTVSLSRDSNSATVRFDDLPEPAEGTVYEMWLVDGSARPAGIVDAAGLNASHTVDGIGSATAFSVTVEPSGGSDQPTTPPIAEISLTA